MACQLSLIVIPSWALAGSPLAGKYRHKDMAQDARNDIDLPNNFGATEMFRYADDGESQV